MSNVETRDGGFYHCTVEVMEETGVIEDKRSIAPCEVVHGEPVCDEGRDDDQDGHRDGVEDVELGKNGDVSGALCRIHGGCQDGGHGGNRGLELGHGEYLGRDDEVGQEENQHHDDPGPHRQEGRHQAQAHRSVGHV